MQTHRSESLSRTSARPNSSQAMPEQTDAQDLQRFLQSPTPDVSPRIMRVAQQHLGNQGVQRLMRQAQRDGQTPAPMPQTPERAPIQRVAHIQQRAGHGVMQRGFFSSLVDPIKKKFMKWVKKQASEQTFGADSERQVDPTKPGYQVQESNSLALSAVNTVEIPSGPMGEHKLKGWHYLAKDSSKGPYAGKTVLFLSGSGNAAENYSQSSAEFYCGKGANVLAVNYRGFGRSKSPTATDANRKLGHMELTDTMLYEDAMSMFTWLTGQSVDAGNVIVHGYSLGGAMAANLVAALADQGVRVAGLVLHSAIDSARKVAVRGQGKKLGNLGADALGSEFDTLAALQMLSKTHPEMLNLPIAVITGTKNDSDQLSDETTGIHKQLGEMGFTNTGKKVVDGKGHAPDHLKNVNAQDVIKNLMGTTQTPTPQQPQSMTQPPSQDDATNQTTTDNQVTVGQVMEDLESTSVQQEQQEDPTPEVI